jgi:hypothetical protein
MSHKTFKSVVTRDDGGAVSRRIADVVKLLKAGAKTRPK